MRGYALDPSLAQRLDTAPVSEVVFRVPWEEVQPGPVGEYLEVVDVDPVGNCFYEPVDLDATLATDGLEPSEHSPQFHQQMVYAVAQLTIHNFERALGRKALWSPGPGKEEWDDSNFVQRLRVYPHALREANAYYSPTKKALLFGYFPASADDSGNHIPGSMVFTALSHDIVAHETAHALLDGQYHRLGQATNPDMLAFHEAFADIVALFQHFTIPEILHHQIASTRGDLTSQQNLLAQLAWQFGHTTGARGALRDAIGRFNRATNQWEPHRPNPAEYRVIQEPHARGAILVAAIFAAFLSIYNARTADLLRLYTGGTGILPAGAVHPDLVKRLAGEARKTASHVLTICVRALDYCPPVDLTFGEYLQALITADFDLVPEDEHDYRVAFTEAFRIHGIYPRDLRTSLRWRTPEEEGHQPSAGLLKILKALRQRAVSELYMMTRRDIFDHERQRRILAHHMLSEHFAGGGEGAMSDAALLGIDPTRTFEVYSARFATRVRPDGSLYLQLFLQLAQEVVLPVGEHGEQGKMRFQGGCTVVADMTAGRPRVAYCIRKPVTSVSRQIRQMQYMAGQAETGLRAVYFGAPVASAGEPFALLHRGIL